MMSVELPLTTTEVCHDKIYFSVRKVGGGEERSGDSSTAIRGLFLRVSVLSISHVVPNCDMIAANLPRFFGCYLPENHWGEGCLFIVWPRGSVCGSGTGI
jgi:hypothetical protein